MSQDIIRVKVNTLDGDSAPMGVAAFIMEDGEEILSDMTVVSVESSGSNSSVLIHTAIRKTYWGQLKQAFK